MSDKIASEFKQWACICMVPVMFHWHEWAFMGAFIAVHAILVFKEKP